MEVPVPNKTIYVADDDLPLFQQAQEVAGGSLSAAIVAALRRYVEIEEGRLEGYKEITVTIGSGGVRRKQRFSGVLIGEWGHSTGSRVDIFRVYRTRTGKYAVHKDRSPDWPSTGGWRSWLGIGETSWGFIQGESTLEVVDSVEALREKIPPELYEMIAGLAKQPAVEDLDI